MRWVGLVLKRFVDVNVNIRNSGNGHEEKYTCKDNYYRINSRPAELLSSSSTKGCDSQGIYRQNLRWRR